MGAFTDFTNFNTIYLTCARGRHSPPRCNAIIVCTSTATVEWVPHSTSCLLQMTNLIDRCVYLTTYYFSWFVTNKRLYRISSRLLRRISLSLVASSALKLGGFRTASRSCLSAEVVSRITKNVISAK